MLRDQDAHLRHAIARRQRVARWARALLLPDLVLTVYFARFGEPFLWAGIAFLALLLGLLMRGESQCCPRCGTSLTKRSWRRQEFASICPGCEYVID